MARKTHDVIAPSSLDLALTQVPPREQIGSALKLAMAGNSSTVVLVDANRTPKTVAVGSHGDVVTLHVVGGKHVHYQVPVKPESQNPVHIRQHQGEIASLIKRFLRDELGIQ